MIRTRPVVSLVLAAVSLAACTSTPETPLAEQAAAMHAFLDPATGVTYYLPVRCLTCGPDAVASAVPRRAGATLPPEVTLVAAVGPVTQVLPRAAGEPARALPAASPSDRGRPATVSSREVVAVSRLTPDPAPLVQHALKPLLKLDTEFASAKRLVLFAAGRTQLGPVGKLAIAELAPWAKQAERVHVTGSADASGQAHRNQQLAVARAATVKSAFIAAGVDRGKIATSVCADCYVAVNETEEGRRLNRRVEVELVLQRQLHAKLPAAVHSVDLAESVPLIRSAALGLPPRN